METIEPSELNAFAGHATDVTDWLKISQTQINQFADCTLDHQFIHVDEERARSGPFGGTIAHGFLSLSLLSHFLGQIGLVIKGAHTFINYGLDRVRFLSPVKADNRIRARAVVESITEKHPGRYLVRYDITVEIEDVEKPALKATFVSMQITA